jgi:hypothetical protein
MLFYHCPGNRATEQEERKMKILTAKVIQYMVLFAVRHHSMPDKNVTIFCIFLPGIVYMTCIKLPQSMYT